MKTLYVLRHAKSSWSDAGLADFDRPLNDRGLAAAPFMGNLMAREDLIPNIIVSSPAKRAMQTATLVKEASGGNYEIRYDERIYEASPITLRQVVSEIDDSFDSAMLVGHNPGFEGLVRYLTGRLETMPTAALAVINLKIDRWADVTGESGDLVHLFRPKEEMHK